MLLNNGNPFCHYASHDNTGRNFQNSLLFDQRFLSFQKAVCFPRIQFFVLNHFLQAINCSYLLRHDQPFFLNLLVMAYSVLVVTCA